MSGGTKSFVLSNVVQRLRVYFQTVSFPAESGKILVSVSDGRTGNGHEHWREVKRGGRTVASLSDCSCRAEVKIPYRGDFRHPKAQVYDFKSLPAAVSFLRNRF